MLVLGELRSAPRRVDVLVGDRLAFDANLLALHGHGLLDLLGGHVLAQARAPDLTLGGVDAQFLLVPGHGVIAGVGFRKTAA